MENKNDESGPSLKGDYKKHLRASFTCSCREGLAGQSLEEVLAWTKMNKGHESQNAIYNLPMFKSAITPLLPSASFSFVPEFS